MPSVSMNIEVHSKHELLPQPADRLVMPAAAKICSNLRFHMPSLSEHALGPICPAACQPSVESQGRCLPAFRVLTSLCLWCVHKYAHSIGTTLGCQKARLNNASRITNNACHTTHGRPRCCVLLCTVVWPPSTHQAAAHWCRGRTGHWC